MAEPLSIAASIAGVISLAQRVFDVADQIFNHDRITISGDIVASFTDLQAEKVRQIQSEIIQFRSERLSQQPAPGVPPLETEDLLHNRLGEALHRYS
jgi:hypothetical protein